VPPMLPKTFSVDFTATSAGKAASQGEGKSRLATRFPDPGGAGRVAAGLGIADRARVCAAAIAFREPDRGRVGIRGSGGESFP